MTGLGPVTSSLPMRCATTCATSACFVFCRQAIHLITQKGLSKADDGTRTRDLLITNEVRYHLCHISLSIELNSFCFARHALLYYFITTLSTLFSSFFIFIKKGINLPPLCSQRVELCLKFSGPVFFANARPETMFIL